MRIVAAVVMLFVMASIPVFADDKAKAAAHYRQGKAFDGAKEYDRAIAEYQQAYALDRRAGHMFNIGLAFHNKGDFKSALEYYEKYLGAEPTGASAKEARERVATATKQLADESAAREKARIAANQQRERDEQELKNKQVVVAAKVKQAGAYAEAGAWVKAGEEHLAAATIDGDPQHLLDAAAAFHKQPDDRRARDAYLAYLEKVPTGENSDQIRTKVAELTKAIEKSEEQERKRLIAAPKGSAVGATSSVAPVADKSMRIRIELAAGTDVAQGAADRKEFGGFALRGGVSLAVREHVSLHGGVHFTGKNATAPGGVETKGTSYDIGIGVEGRGALNQTVDGFVGGMVLYGKTSVEVQGPMKETLLDISVPGLSARAGLALGRKALGLSIYGMIMRAGLGNEAYGFIGLFGSLSYGFL